MHVVLVTLLLHDAQRTVPGSFGFLLTNTLFDQILRCRNGIRRASYTNDAIVGARGECSLLRYLDVGSTEMLYFYKWSTTRA
jgi:hypothetical protein